MSTSEANLTLVIKARDLSQSVMRGLESNLGKVRTAAQKIAPAFSAGLRTITPALNQLFNDILNEKDIGKSAQAAGMLAAGALVDAYAAELIAKLLGSSFIQAVGAAIVTAGTTLGELMGMALSAAVALWPVLLIAAIVAIIAVLIANPEIRDKVIEMGGKILGALVNGLEAAGDLVGEWMRGFVDLLFKIPGMLVDLGGKIVDAIIKGFGDFAQRVAIIVRQAFENLNINVGPFHISGKHGISVDLPDFGPDAAHKGMTYQEAHGLTQHAAGGWAGLNGPEISMLGEKGPEFVLSNAMLRGLSGGGGSDMVMVPVSRRALTDAVEEEMYFRLSRTAPTRGR